MGDSKIRVLFILPALVAGGAERVVLTLLRNLSRDRFDITLAVACNDNAVLLNDLPSDIRTFDFKTPRLRMALPKIIRHIRKHKPDVVFSTLDYLNVALGLTRLLWPSRTRLIARPAIFFSADLRTRRNRGLWRLMSRLSLIGIDFVVFQSAVMERDYRDSLNWRKGLATVIHNPLDLALIRERVGESVDTGFRQDRFNLVAAGRLEEQKGFDLAIESIALSRNKNITLTVLGDGSLRHALEDLIQKRRIQDRVRLLGYIHNPYPYYAQADGFLLSSRFEGFPNVVLEALACQTAVVATPVAGLKDILEGVPGCYLSAGYTASDLAETISLFASRGRCTLSANTIAGFDSRHIIDEYEKMIEGVYSGISIVSGSQL